jgi:pimeloyl-ACP methyl ester carboxylesterase
LSGGTTTAFTSAITREPNQPSSHEFLPRSELFLLPGAGHFVQMDEPQEVARLILDMPVPSGRLEDT